MPMPERSVGSSTPAGWTTDRLPVPGQLLLLLTALLVHAVSLCADRVVDNIDLRTHYQWAWQFQSALSEGVLYPRWMPLANGGLGEPAFVIIHPAWYGLVAGLSSLGFDLWLAMRLAAFLSTVALGLLVFQTLRRHVTPAWALGAAMLLQASPFGVFLFGFHAALPWHFSLAGAAAVILWSVNEKRSGPALAAAVALLSVTHLLVTFMVLLCVGASLLAEAIWKRRGLLFARWLLPVSVGLGCGAVYWLLAATSGGLFNAATRADEFYLSWRNSFAWPFVTAQLFGTRWALAQWVLPLVPLVGLVIAGVPLLRWYSKGRDDNGLLAARLAAVAGFALVLASELSYPLYASFGFMTNVQWPYRFIAVASLAAPLAVALALGHQAHLCSTRQRLALAVACALSMLLAAALLVKQFREGERQVVSSVTLVGEFGQPGALPVGVGPYWREYLRNGGLEAECAAANWRCQQLVNGSAHAQFQLSGDAAARLRLPRFAFPAWHLTLNGRRVEIERDASTGLLMLSLPAGDYRVDLRWASLWQERVGAWVSITSVLAWFGWVLGRWYTGRRGVAADG
jgi:hypothetical protein